MKTHTSPAPKMVTCYKCLGAKRFEKLAHIENGVCFVCNGAGVTEAKDRPLPKFNAPAYGPHHELRNMYRAARSQGRDWADAPDGDYDVVQTVGYHMARVPADVAVRALDAFAGVLTAKGAARVRAAYEAALAKLAA